MTPVSTYWMSTTGTYQVSVDLALDWKQTYLLTWYLTLTSGDDYGHIKIWTLCHYCGGDVVLCGVRDIGDDFNLGVTEFISAAARVTVKLKTTGGKHRAEGVLYQL